MISLKLQIFIAIIIFLMAAIIIRMVSKEKIDLRYAIGWLFLLLLALLMDIFPEGLFWFSGLIGVALPVNMIFMVSVFLLVAAAYLITAALSRIADKTKRLTQESALLEKEIEVLKTQNRLLSDEVREMKKRLAGNDSQPRKGEKREENGPGRKERQL